MGRPFVALLQRRLDALGAAGRLRLPEDPPTSGPPRPPPAPPLELSSNDYLGLGRGGVSRETLRSLEHKPAGGRASRLIFGTHATHLELEHELADWVGLPAALLFSSGYAANVGTLAALADSGDVVLSDALNHASIIDGCRLSPARTAIYAHRNLDELRALLQREHDARHRWVVTESYFSMDADTPDLAAMAALCREHDASLVVDEAHALGVFGPSGSGLLRAAGVTPDVLIGTLGKAVGAQGAFVAGPPELRTYLWNRARSLVFSTAPSPVLAALTLEQVRRARGADAERRRLRQNCETLRARLCAAGVPLASDSHGPILPILLGSNDAALQAARLLEAQGLRARAIRPPTVPAGQARLRITVDATLDARTLDDVARALETLAQRCTA